RAVAAPEVAPAGRLDPEAHRQLGDRRRASPIGPEDAGQAPHVAKLSSIHPIEYSSEDRGAGTTDQGGGRTAATRPSVSVASRDGAIRRHHRWSRQPERGLQSPATIRYRPAVASPGTASCRSMLTCCGVTPSSGRNPGSG